MKAIRLTNEKGELIEMENSLEALQSEVGGLIEVITLTDEMAMIVNEEGRLRGYAINDPATDVFSNFKTYSPDFIVGNALIVGVDGENFTDLRVTQVVRITNLLKSLGYYKKED